ncbi:alanine racemase [Rhizobium mongolense subsp. loessense]|uniref:alanine racemase n=1 Tax=Rhizobium mongolense subsp. loessense TaxID=158890 RepID=A0A1G4SDZ2_9HYPH|nr:alanine racemase [Rhizobium mongolense]SCW66559.1 alanine racemase [Rhizobium mongolense subsp. loessense]
MSSSEPELEIDLCAIGWNFRVLTALTAATVSAVVKSDAYGLGLEAVAGGLFAAGCRSYFVADLSEAEKLRRILPRAAIYVLAPDYAADPTPYHERRLVPVCNSLEDATCAALSAERASYAVNLETGFHRFGLTFDDVRRLAQTQTHFPAVALSHLACAETREAATNALQWNRFVSMCEMLRPRGRSLGASAAIWLGRRFHFDLIRAGSALYGLKMPTVDPSPIRPVVRLRAPLVAVQTACTREAVGYGATFTTSRVTRIGTLALGYSHGLPFAAANRISVSIGAHQAPLIGRVAMEYATVDLTDVPESLCRPGIGVEVVGPHLPVDDLARAAQTNPQEILLRLGAGCRRRYANSPVGTVEDRSR